MKKLNTLYISICIHNIPYSRKVWQGESLANLVNHQQFTKLKPSKSVVIIITLWLNLLFHQTFPRQTLKKSKFAKLSRYTVAKAYELADI